MSNFLSIFKPGSFEKASGFASYLSSSPSTPYCAPPEDRDEVLHAVPLSIICTKYLHFLPWEYAFSCDVNVTRFLCLHAIVNIPSEQLQAKTLPSSVPQLFGYSHKGREYDVRTKQAQTITGAFQRVLWELGQADTLPGNEVGPKVEHVANQTPPSSSSSSALRGPAEARYLRRVPHMVSQDLSADLWPLTTPPLPLGSSGGLSVKLTRRRQISVFDASQAGTNFFSVLSWLDNCANSHHQESGMEVPCFILSYADLARFCESTLCLLTSRPDCVLLFVPPSSAEAIIREISNRREVVTSLSRDRRKAGPPGDWKLAVSPGAGGDGMFRPSIGGGNENSHHCTRGLSFHGDSSYEVLVSAVHAVRNKYHIPVVLFNL